MICFYSVFLPVPRLPIFFIMILLKILKGTIMIFVHCWDRIVPFISKAVPMMVSAILLYSRGWLSMGQ